MKALTVAAICALLFIILAITVPEEGANGLDAAVQQLVRQGGEPEQHMLWKSINELGSTTGFAAVTLLMTAAVWLLGKRKDAVLLVSTVVTSLLLNQVLKSMFARVRPVHDKLIEADGYSFPSGNATVGIALYGFLIYIIWQYAPVWARALALLAGAVLIGMIGYARLYYGVHYVTDIAAGYAAGLLCIALAAYARGRLGKRVPESGDCGA
ncbi:phosphatase PAP2 family protein [Paenibacillus sp. YYML68]|uniref:phosphatase PAP2 family protein n=1 Tax=Paenibacillus sp. YYML68 TaxID=2909250 RepID=UPI00248FC927|nr:phosphatase PAP2 family protein [Paenibacillus sp. YYML68]